MNNIENAVNIAKSLSNVMDVIYDIRPTAKDISDLCVLSNSFDEVFSFVKRWVNNESENKHTDFEGDQIDLLPVVSEKDNTETAETVVEQPKVDTTTEKTESVVSKANLLPATYIENICYWIAINCNGMKLVDARKKVRERFEHIVSYQILMRITRKESYKAQTDMFFTLSDDKVIHAVRKLKKPDGDISELKPISFGQFDTAAIKKAKAEQRKKEKKEKEVQEKAKSETPTIDEKLERESLMAFVKIHYKGGEITDKVIKSFAKLKTCPVTKDMPMETYKKYFVSEYVNDPSLIERDIYKLTRTDLINIAKVYFDISLCITKKPIVKEIGTILICMVISKMPGDDVPVKDIIDRVRKTYNFTPNSKHIFCIRNGSLMPTLVQKMWEIDK